VRAPRTSKQRGNPEAHSRRIVRVCGGGWTDWRKPRFSGARSTHGGYSAMDLSTQKEQFSIAYIHALSAVAGLKLDRYSIDDDSIDVLLSRAGRRSPHLSLQLKCSSNIDLKPDHFSFRIKLKNYDDLRRKTMVPRILAVLHVPEALDDWLSENSDHILLRHRAYWVSLLGEVEINATKPEDWQEKKITVRVPRSNLLNPARLGMMMDNIERTDAI